MEQKNNFDINKLKGKNIIPKILGGIVLLFMLYSISALVETVKKGTYQIKQAAITGTMSAKMTPGIWLQLWGDIQAWNKAETFYFTADSDEGARRDQSMEVRFNDGSLCNISGTLRILMPTSESGAIEFDGRLTGKRDSMRGPGAYEIGADITTQYLKKYDRKLIIRGHTAHGEGHMYIQENQVLSMFSAGSYNITPQYAHIDGDDIEIFTYEK